jgi:hypothetical protein
MTATSIAVLCLSLLGGYQEEVEAAKADYNQYGPNVRYVYMGLQLPPEILEVGPTAQAFWFPHLTTTEVLEQQIPVRVGDTGMYRIDLDSLYWLKVWSLVSAEYPYRPKDWYDLLIIRGDWFIAITSVTRDSNLYYELLYANTVGGIPKNKAELDKALGLQKKTLEAAFILDQGISGVALDTRLVVHKGTAFGPYYETFDSFGASFEKDPTEHLADGRLKFDAQEVIFALTKKSRLTGDIVRCQGYWLNNGAGVRQEEAPTNIVIDYSKFRNEPSVRTPGSCVCCHPGLNGAPLDEFGEPYNHVKLLIQKGVILSDKFKDKRVQNFVEGFHLTKHSLIIKRATEDFELFCQLATGEKASHCIESFRTVVEWYDKPVTLEQAARELYTDAETLGNAIAYWSEVYGPQFNEQKDSTFSRFKSLPSGFACPRKTWEGKLSKGTLGAYHYAAEAMTLWRKTNENLSK